MKTVRFKMICTLAVCICTIFQTAYASDVEIEPDGCQVIITEKAYPYADVLMVVAGHDTDINNVDNIYSMVYSTADENGMVRFVFDMPDDRLSGNDGKYDIYLKTSGDEELLDEFVYSTVSDRKDIINRIASGEDIKALLGKSENSAVFGTIGCNIKDYSELNDNDRNKVTEMIAGDIEDISSVTIEKFMKTFNAAVALAQMKNTSKGPYRDYLLQINPEFENVTYSDIEDTALLSRIDSEIEKNNNFTDIEKFRTFYDEINIYYIINNMRVDDVKNNLKKYSGVLGIENMSGYKSYMSLKNTHQADEKIVKSLKTHNVSTAKELDGVLGNAIQNEGSSGSSGGTGTSSSKSTIQGLSDNGANNVVALPTTNYALNTFGDIESVPWAREAINSLATKGIINGYEDNTFRPLASVKREEFLKMLLTALNISDDNAECHFSDVDSNAWYYKYVASAYNMQIVNGMSSEIFGVGQYLTRQDMAVICARALAGKENSIIEGRTGVFDDEAEISEYAKAAVKKLYSMGIINGMEDNLFKPIDTVNRAQAAVLIYNLVK